MRSARIIAGILFYISRLAAWLSVVIATYALIVILLSKYSSASWLPIRVPGDGSFTIFFPFTHTPFLLGEYSNSFLIINLLTLGFYGLFLWLLSDVFHAVKQPKLFTKKGVMQLSRFYITNLTLPLLLFVVIVLLRQELTDIVRITILHLIIGVFAFFMASIFKQGLILQEEQDLIF